MVLALDTFFRALADPTRLRCLMLLVHEAELCVCEFTHALDELQPKISRHLASLREDGLVADRRTAQWIHYRINPALPAWAKETLALAAHAHSTTEPYVRDRKRLKTMTDRPLTARRCD